MITTLGRELVRSKLPEGYKDWADKSLEKKNLIALTTKMALDDPDGYAKVLNGLNDVGEDVVTLYGRDAALSYAGLAPDKATEDLRSQLKTVVNTIMNDPKLSTQQKEDKILELGYKYTAKVQEAVFDDQNKRHTALASQINSGSRGNKTQLMQMMFGNMMMKDALNRDIPFLHMDPYLYGVSPMAYWVSASAGRKGMYDLQAATGRAGYLGKQVAAVTHDAIIDQVDCGTTDTGSVFKAADPQNIGHVLLRPFKGHPAGSVVDEDMIAEADDKDEMLLRTPTTCKSRHGICAKCNGLSENGKFPGVGSYVPLNAARSFVEKVTQAGINSKHGSGIGGKKYVDPDGEDQPVGFTNMERMFMAPINFPGGAVLASTDGVVSSIRPAPQGGSYITIGTSTIYCAPERAIKVKTGDRVMAGDILTNGVPNPSEMVSYKGIGQGRRYYLDKLGEILAKEGAGVNRANLEAFTRTMVNKVKITDPDGYKDWLPGDIVSYSDIAATYTPRESAAKTRATEAVGKYLEVPVLHYSIGTRITKDVADTLNRHGFDSVLTAQTPPPFDAVFLRPSAVLQNDGNWLPRLAGERLYDSMFDAAQRGITDSYDSTSYVNRIVAAPFKREQEVVKWQN